MKNPTRLHMNHLRLILTLSVDLLTLAETVMDGLDYLPPWLIPNRNNSAWWPFKPPTHQRTPFLLFSGWLSMTTVIATALASAAANHIEMLITIPVYALFAMVVLQLRQQRLDMSAG
jgi:hypothetical protein